MKKLTITLMLIILVLGLAVYALAESEKDVPKGEKADAPKVFDAPQAVGTMATCPVTGENFKITEDSLHSEYKGKHVYFCCAGCKPAFDKDPEKYLKKE